jgi:hypothetical protein
VTVVEVDAAAVLVLVVVVVGTLVAGAAGLELVDAVLAPPLELPQPASKSTSTKRSDLLMFRRSSIA